jgi:copper chaperone NosL
MPPDIRYGEDVCDECGMLIAEEGFAAAYRTADGTARRFDDIGNMLAYDARRREEVLVYWVHDYHTRAWLRAPNAFFVSSPDLITPMGHGLTAFGTQAGAEEFAARSGGEILSFDALRQRYAESSRSSGGGHHLHAAHGM